MTDTKALTPATTAAIGDALETYQRLEAIRNVLAPDLNDQELQLFAIVARNSRLDPFARQIHAIKRQGKLTFQTGIDGFRSSAEETGEYRGSDEPTFGQTIAEPFPHPEWARVVVHRQFSNGERLDQPATVAWDEFYPGDNPQGFMWKKMPRNQLAKCAEAAAFRRAFPKRFGGVYAEEEMHQADASELARPVGPTAAERIAERRAQAEARAQAEDIIDGEAVDEEAPPALAERLRALAGSLELVDGGDAPASNEQKAALRDALAAIDVTAIGPLVKAAFGLTATQGANGPRFQVNQAQAQALLEEHSRDPEAFVREAAELATS